MAAPAGIAGVVVAAVLFVLPPHSSIVALVIGIAGVAAFALGTTRFAGGPWWALILALVSGALLFAALTVGGRGLALHTFGLAESCQVIQREEVDTRSRYQHYGFVHTLSCPRGGTFTIRTDSTDRQRAGTTVEVLDTPGGLLEPDFASRHNLAFDVVAVIGSIAFTGAAIWFTRFRVRAAN
ncbi:hypothetical protein GCM10017566_20530 [Amycolatopsis bartoniae]|uniref:DUF3592 domain-containing protein n=1 Tax=Amycolatopsis bartoniae TaxID=941986 RepID=A0A8H9IQZ2_9PSEU|nr:hypothetical protein GCM10017566_20530 [Amycolatopsis bartoniae]